MWFVIKPFTDLKDKDHSSKGDPFPKEVSEKKKLSFKKQEPLIEERSSDEKPCKKRGRPKKKE